MNKNDKSMNQNKKRRGKSNYRVDRDKRKDDVVTEDDKMHKYNDPMWYAKNEAMLRDAASYSYNNPVGTTIPYLISKGTSNSTGSLVIPSLFSFVIVPSIGISKDAASPANLAANNIYSYVRYMNSGSKNYDQPDLMLYLLAMDSLYSCWNWMKRIYGYAFNYSQYDRTVPRSFAAADGVDLQDLYDNLAEFRLFLNRTAAQITSFCVPAVMPYFIRHSWMYSNIYRDSNNNKAQYYTFNPAGFYKYEEVATKFGGSLSFIPLEGFNADSVNGLTFKDLVNYMSNMLNSVAYSEDIGVMSGDILKAYGNDKLFKLTPVESDYRVEPVYNEEVLNQMHNSTIVPVPFTAPNKVLDVTQDPNTGFLIWNPSFTPSGETNKTYPQNYMINMPWDDVTPANTMVGTRLTAAYTKSGDTITVAAVGSELVCARRIYVMATSGNELNVLGMYENTMEIGPTNLGPSLTLIHAMSNFDWHPLVPLISKGADGTKAAYCGIMGDVSNYTVLNLDNLKNLHLTAIMSEFNIPQLGSF